MDKKEKINNIIEKFSDVIFKPEGLGALEFEKEIFTRNFKKEKVNFRIERVSIQVADKLSKFSDDIEGLQKALATFIAQPYEARNIDFYELDYGAMEDILELASAFQETPFLFTKGAREPKEEITN